MTTDGSLSGLLVVALEQAVAAPYCSSRLADAGARVIKIERPDGDFARHYDSVVHGESAYFVWLNRGKESVVLDIKNADDREIAWNMIGRADVFIQNLAPGAASRAGFDADSLRRANRRLITVSISGYGGERPGGSRKAYDFLLQCETGLASITGSAGEPGRVGVSVCDIACGMYAHAAVLQALIERHSTGTGQDIRVSLFDSLADWMTVPLLHHDYGGEAPRRAGLNHPSIAPYGAYTCGGGACIVIAIQNEREWIRFCSVVLGDPDLAADPRFGSNSARVEHRDELDDRIGAVFSRVARDEIVERLTAADIAYGSLNSVSDFSKHEQLRRETVESPGGPVDVAARPALPQSRPLGKVPALGEHTARLREEFSCR